MWTALFEQTLLNEENDLNETQTAPIVLYEERGAVAVATLNRPETLNALSTPMFQQLRMALRRAEDNPVIRALVLTGSGRAFCAGGDLSERDLRPGDDLVERASPGPLVEQEVNTTVRQLQALRMPTLAAVNGVAVGAGVSLVLGCDIALAAPGASFIQAFSKIGLIPDAGGSWLLVERLGLARALALAMTGQKLGAAQARDWGMIWDVMDDPLTATLVLAEQLAAMPTLALVATRHLLRDAATRSLDSHLDVERDTLIALGRSRDYLEGVSAFMEKRTPQFKGC